MPDDALTEAADAIVRAMNDSGPVPKHHYEHMRLLIDEWPTLYHAILQLMTARGAKLEAMLRIDRGDLSAMPPDLERKLRDSL